MDDIAHNTSFAFNNIEDIDSILESYKSNVDNSDDVLNWIPSTYVTTEYNIDDSLVEQQNIKFPTFTTKFSKEARQTLEVCKNSGEEYITVKGRVVEPRTMKEMGLCRMKCREKIDYSTRAKLFMGYWSGSSHSHRVSYIASLVKSVTKKSTKPKTCSLSKQKNREHSYKYTLVVNNHEVEVCKKCFLIVFGENKYFVNKILTKKLNSLI